MTRNSLPRENYNQILNETKHIEMCRLQIKSDKNQKILVLIIALTEAALSSSFSHFCWSCLWRVSFSSDIRILLARIWDWTLAIVCMHRNVVVAWRLTDGPCIRDFNLASPLKARNALLAWNNEFNPKRNIKWEKRKKIKKMHSLLWTDSYRSWLLFTNSYDCDGITKSSLN